MCVCTMYVTVPHMKSRNRQSVSHNSYGGKKTARCKMKNEIFVEYG